jgi:hypothetical protein
VVWDGRDESGRRSLPGLYFVTPVWSDGRAATAHRLVIVR